MMLSNETLEALALEVLEIKFIEADAWADEVSNQVILFNAYVESMREGRQ